MVEARRFVVPDAAAGKRLDQVVADLLDVSRSRAARHVDDGDVAVDGRARPRSHRVAGGERVEVRPPVPAASTPPPPVPPVLYRDDHLLVLDKPAGLVVHPGHGRPDGTLVDALLAGRVPVAGGEPGRPGIVHRLDKDTSGAMLVALDADAHAALVAALADRRVTRSYLALVDGRLPAGSGTIDVPLGRDRGDRTRFAARADGRRAVTHFTVQAEGRVADGRPVQLVACRLETGRTHQIRVHLAHAGAPVVGDDAYGASGPTAAALDLDRPFLHALQLELAHPHTGQRLALEAPVPADLVAALRTAGLDPADADAERITWPA